MWFSWPSSFFCSATAWCVTASFKAAGFTGTAPSANSRSEVRFGAEMQKRRSCQAPPLICFHALQILQLSLAMFTTMFAAAMRRCGVRRAAGRSTMPRRCVCPVIVADACWRRTTTIRCIPAPAVSARAHVSTSVVPASAATAEAMLAPAVAVSPVCPWAHAQEDAVIEISRPIKAAWRAAIRCIVVVAVGTDGRYAYAYADCDLRPGHRHQCQGSKVVVPARNRLRMAAYVPSASRS